MIPDHMFEYCKDSLETLEAHSGMPWDQLVFSMPGVEVFYEIIQAGILPPEDTHPDQLDILEKYVKKGKVILDIQDDGMVLISTSGHVANGKNLTRAIEELR